MIEELKKIKIKINLDELNNLKNGVKKNFEKIKEYSYILEKYPFLENDINIRIDNGVLFQPGRIVETMVIQSISDTLGCTYIGNGIYENIKYYLKQDGGSGMPDLIFFDKINNIKHTIEIKEPVAYGKSSGFIYDDNGKPTEFTTKDKLCLKYIETLFDDKLTNYNILENQGHNKIFEIDDIITNKFDYIISYDNDGYLNIMTIDEYRKNFSFRIEVRSCGRNTRKVFTKNKLNLKDDIVYLDETNIKDIIPRLGFSSKRCKYISNNATFSFQKKHLMEINGNLAIHLDKIKQHVGEVSIQHFRND